MKRHRIDSIRFLSLILTGLLLLIAAGGPAWVTVAAPVRASAVMAEKSQKTKQPTDSAPQAVLQTASFEAVVTPAVSFDFSQAVFLLPPPVLLFVLEQPALPRLFEVPYFYFSFFRHVFGHHIAINAP